MNYGYALLNEDGKILDDLTEEVEINEMYCLQLYYYISATKGNVKSMKGKTLLEVGSGRGGGLTFLTKRLQPEKAVGVDFSQNQVDFCKNTHKLPNLTFVQGDAEKLTDQIKEGSVDYAINVESSHCYGKIDKFFEGINDVLKNDGIFYYTDFRGSNELEELQTKLEEHFEVVDTENISKNVMHALKLDTTRRLAFIQDMCPKIFVPLINKFSGVEGTRIYNELEDKSSVYYAWVLKKKTKQ